jgi:hypothetical protein
MLRFPMPVAKVLHIEVLEAGRPYRYEVVAEGSYLVGASDRAQVVLEHPEVPRTFAFLHHEGQRVTLEPTGECPVCVNGERVGVGYEVAPADTVLCGPYELRFRLAPQEDFERVSLEPVEVALLNPDAVTACGRAADEVLAESLRQGRTASAPFARAFHKVLRRLLALSRVRWIHFRNHAQKRVHHALLPLRRRPDITSPSLTVTRS